MKLVSQAQHEPVVTPFVNTAPKQLLQYRLCKYGETDFGFGGIDIDEKKG